MRSMFQGVAAIPVAWMTNEARYRIGRGQCCASQRTIEHRAAIRRSAFQLNGTYYGTLSRVSRQKILLVSRLVEGGAKETGSGVPSFDRLVG